MKSSPDIVGVFVLLATGGRTRAAHSGYRPAHRIHDNYLSSGEHTYPDRGIAEVGQRTRVEVTLITPHVYPRSIWAGRILQVYEGAKCVGTLEVAEVRNPVLIGNAESFRGVWEPPPGLGA